MILAFLLLATYINGKDIPLLRRGAPIVRRGDVQKRPASSCELPSEPIRIHVKAILPPIIEFFILHGKQDAADFLIEFELPVMCSIVRHNHGNATTPSTGMCRKPKTQVYQTNMTERNGFLWFFFFSVIFLRVDRSAQQMDFDCFIVM